MKLSDYLTSNAISRREFASRIGVTEAALCRYISGDRVPRPQIARAIMAASEGAVTPNDLLAELSDPQSPQAAE